MILAELADSFAIYIYHNVCHACRATVLNLSLLTSDMCAVLIRIFVYSRLDVLRCVWLHGRGPSNLLLQYRVLCNLTTGAPRRLRRSPGIVTSTVRKGMRLKHANRRSQALVLAKVTKSATRSCHDVSKLAAVPTIGQSVHMLIF